MMTTTNDWGLTFNAANEAIEKQNMAFIARVASFGKITFDNPKVERYEDVDAAYTKAYNSLVDLCFSIYGELGPRIGLELSGWWWTRGCEEMIDSIESVYDFLYEAGFDDGFGILDAFHAGVPMEYIFA